jgi:hypothetical protein
MIQNRHTYFKRSGKKLFNPVLTWVPDQPGFERLGSTRDRRPANKSIIIQNPSTDLKRSDMKSSNPGTKEFLSY